MSVNISERFAKMGLGEKIILIAAPLLLIDSFLPWYDVDFGVGSITRSGWESPGALWSMLAVILSLVAFGKVALSSFTSMQIPSDFGNPNITWGRIHLGLGGASALFILFKLLNESSFLGFGFYIGIVLVAVLAAGGYLIFQQEQKGNSPSM
ncbi:MAG: hypothetical protein ABIP58_00290 [Dehalococcoidia bacterium]